MDAMNAIKDNIEQLFMNAPKSRAAFELKEELLANSLDRYEDLLQEGKQPEQAVQIVLNSIGNVDELFAELPQEQKDWAQDEKKRQISAIIISVSVGLYILAGLILISSSFTMGIALAILPTCLLVYNSYTQPNKRVNDATVVEDFKKWNRDTKSMKGLMVAISIVIWTIALVLFFGIGMFYAMWHVAWLVFIVAACIEAIVYLVFKIKELY